MTRPTGAPKGNQNALRHGLSALKVRVKIQGLQAIDRRTATARLLIQWRNALVTDLGGEDNLSAQQKAIVDMAVKTRLYIATVDAFLMEQPSIVNRQKRCVLPVVRERTQLADSLARYLQALGLERKAKPIPNLADYIKAKYGKAKDGDAPQTPPVAASVGDPEHGAGKAPDPARETP